MRNKKGVLLLGLLLPLALVSAFALIRPQKSASEQKRHDENQFAKLDAELPIVDFTGQEPTDAKERAKREAKSKRYYRGRQNVGPETTVTTYFYHWPEGFTALPVDQSDAIIIGEVSKAQAFLSTDKSTVYSEYSIKPETTLKETQSEISHAKSVLSQR